MTYEIHEILSERHDDDQELWHYMGFTKFMNIVQEGSLPHIRLANFSDSAETALPTAISVPEEPWPSEPEEENRYRITFAGVDSLQDLLDIYLENTYVTCWHASNYESYAMWKIYGYTDRSIGIKTTLGRLKDALRAPRNGDSESDSGSLYVSEVEYLDFELAFDELNEQLQNRIGAILKQFEESDAVIPPFTPAIFKQQYYEYEQELRTIYVNDDVSHKRIMNYPVPDDEIPDAYLADCNLDKLVEGIYLSPDLDNDSWEANTVRTFLDGCKDVSLTGEDVYPSKIGSV